MNIVKSSLWLVNKTGPAAVHSVFSRSLNLLMDGSLFTLQNPGGPLVPMGAITERACNFSHLGFCPGQPALLEKQRWLIGDSVFAFSSSRLVDLTLSPASHDLDEEKTCAAIDEITRFCRVRETQAPLASLLYPSSFADPVLTYIGGALQELVHSSGDIPRFCRTITAITGSGPGLTPSGDDILTGILFALVREGDSPGIGELLHGTIEAVQGSMHKTTLIAAEFLHHATEARFATHFLALAGALKNERNTPLTAQLLPFANFGHSSGIDSLVGIVFGLKITLSILRNGPGCSGSGIPF